MTMVTVKIAGVRRVKSRGCFVEFDILKPDVGVGEVLTWG